MTITNWQLNDPIDAVVFDCDGTLSRIEGIDELAKKNGKKDIIASMTAEAMGKTGLTPELYEQRLSIIKPSKEQVYSLVDDYFTNRTAHAENVIALLKKLKKSIYILSAGLFPAVKLFGEQLTIAAEHVFAVDVTFDSKGSYVDFDKSSPLINNDGKKIILQSLSTQHRHILYIGDGLNDLIAKDHVTRFIGFGGYIHRDLVAQHCDFYLTKPSLLGILAFLLTADEVQKLSEIDRELHRKALIEANLDC